MQTQLIPEIQATIAGAEADSILRRCVHCGMCNATCPSYQLLGDELDGPRGRIYLIKQMLEGHQPTEKTRTHLDRCLTCRSCETTCPSGVQYHRLLEIGKAELERRHPSSLWRQLQRSILKQGLSNPRLFQLALNVGRYLRPVLPAALSQKIPAAMTSDAALFPGREHSRKVIMLAGCVQPALGPEINAAAARVLDACGVQTIFASQVQCCGAIALHLDDAEQARRAARANIDAWIPLLDQGAEAIVMTASGCGLMVTEYPQLLADDMSYAQKATRLASVVVDLGQYLQSFQSRLIELFGGDINTKLAWHAPCTLQHGLKRSAFPQQLLTALGAEVHSCQDAHLCCGSAGTYSLTQKQIALQLRDQKLQALEELNCERIVSANMACQLHLQTGTKTPVEHWILVLDRALKPSLTANPA